MFLKSVFMAVFGLSFGFLVSAGVFTVLISVGLVPRFAGKTHTSKKVFLYEEMVVAGTLFGNFISVFDVFLPCGGMGAKRAGVRLFYRQPVEMD